MVGYVSGPGQHRALFLRWAAVFEASRLPFSDELAGAASTLPSLDAVPRAVDVKKEAEHESTEVEGF